MKIGIDCTSLPPNPVGAGNYIIQLVRAVTAFPSQHEFVIFAQQRGRALIGELPGDRVQWALSTDMPPALRLLWEQVRLPRAASSAGIDLLHSLHYTRPRFLSCASVVTFHDMTFFLYPELHTRSKRIFFPWAIRMSARRSEAIISDSESTRRDAIRILGIPPEKIVAVPLGISEEFKPIADTRLLDSIRKKYHLPERFILFVGLIEPRKNLPLLLRAYARLVEREDPPPLVLAGRLGWDSGPFFQLIEDLKLKQNIHLPGYIPAVDLPVLYNLAQIFVYPSSYEGFGFPPLEAMACGTPVITTAVSAMLDNVGDAGLLVPPQDEEALVSALHELLENPGLREQFSSAGIRRAGEFTWQRTAEETIQVYEKASRSK